MNGFWNPSRETFSRAVHQSWQKSMNVLSERTIQKIPWCWGEEKAESKDVLIQIHGHFYMTRLYHFRGDTSSLLAQGTGVSIPCLYQASLCIPTYSQVCWGYHLSIDHQIEFVEFFPSIKKKKSSSPKLWQQYVQGINEGWGMKAANVYKISASYWNCWRYPMEKMKRKL